MTPPLFVPALGRSLYPGASVALDFTRNLYRSGTPVVKGSPSLLSGWTFARASTGYAETAAGALVAFASGAPRITDKGLLVEESRINLRTYSADFSNGAWAPNNLNQTGTPAWSNVSIAPDGTQTADKLIATSTSGSHRVVGGAVATTATSVCTMSVYAKAAEYSKIAIGEFNNGVGWGSYNLSTGTVITSGAGGTASIQALADGWFRLLLTFTAGAFSRFDIYALNDAYVANEPSGYAYSGDGTSGLFVWGAQLELGAFPTSYIPTTTASATRAADAASITGLVLASAFTLVTEANADVVTGTFRVATCSDGTTSNRFGNFLAGSTALRNLAVVGGASAQVESGARTQGVVFKQASKFDGASTFASSGVGAAVVSNTNAIAPSSLTQLGIGSLSGIYDSAGYVRRILIYPYAFTNAQLQAAST